MKNVIKSSSKHDKKLSLSFEGEFSLYRVELYDKALKKQDLKGIKVLDINLSSLSYFDTASALFLLNLIDEYSKKNIELYIHSSNQDYLKTIELVKKKKHLQSDLCDIKKPSIFNKVGTAFYQNYLGLLSFFAFLGKLFATKLHYLLNPKNIRIKEIIYEINESGVRALGIVALTSFLIGLVVA